MVKLSSLRKGEEVLLRNGKKKVYGIERFNIKHVVAVKRHHKWLVIYDNGNRFFEILQFFRW